ncbi:hypothetical protein D3P07_17085 [Paenibacillus sp. 1011MAR3C5]|uniref:hypothetical protein n=1 Tax=Paenibacillus sp. 1011MAR3C5 TaxID=1675787 RepID=UPI000E6CB2CF|nr:hypothetical protein [Paenibacillus sp. 1011MAR3C5]RJE86896.1 hypothetical protein D3P07_17085 [Paenibacillus sp. 1011MAR3C5]
MQSVRTAGLAGNDMSIQLFFGFTLFLAMFTIGFKINSVMEEKAFGIWNRVNLSLTWLSCANA